VRERRRGEPPFDEQPELIDGRHREQPRLLQVREGPADRLIEDHMRRISGPVGFFPHASAANLLKGTISRIPSEVSDVQVVVGTVEERREALAA
jgi:hypothetical protein